MIKLVSDTINQEDINHLIKWLSQNPTPRLTKGNLTWDLEKKWAKKIGTDYSVFVNSGSSAILLTLAALKYLNRIPDGKIVVPGLSWSTDVSSPMLLGLQPFLCDCNLEDLSCDLNHLENIFKEESPSTLILVSPLGLVPQMEKIVKLCKKYNVTLLEDVCESMGSKFKDKYLGSFGVASFFSMYFGHHLSTIEGGFINTNDEELYHILLMMRSHGWDRDLPKWKQNELREKHDCTDFESLYNFYVPGFNLRATDLQAFLGIRAIDKLDDYVNKRVNNFKYYKTLLKDNKLTLTTNSDHTISSFAIPILNENREEIVRELQDENIEVRPLIAGNMGNKPMWTNVYGKVSLPNCELIDEEGFYVPNHQDLTLKEIKQIAHILNSYKLVNNEV